MYLLYYFKILLLIVPIVTFSQSIIWEQNFGEILYDQGYSIELTEDNGYIVAGRKGAISESIENTPSLSVDGEFHIIKIKNNGDIEWEQNYEDTTGFSYAKCIKKDNINGGYIIGGSCLLKLNDENPPEIEWFNYDINSEDINDRMNICKTYGNLGIAYKNLLEYEESLLNFEKQLNTIFINYFT